MVEEVRQVDRMLGELARLPAEHPLRAGYEAELTSALAALRAALADGATASTGVSLARSQMDRFKLRLDEARVEMHGKLLQILEDKAAADAFFRTTSKAPGIEDEEPAGEAPAAETAAPPQS